MRWFLVIGAIVGLVSVAVVPVARPLDEPAHLRRVETLGNGVLIPPAQGHTTSGYVVDGCLESLLDRSIGTFVDLAGNSPSSLSTWERWHRKVTNPRCEATRPLRGGGPISGTEVNTPIPYVPALVGFEVGRHLGGALGGVYGARLVQLLVYLLLCGLALKRLPWGKPYLFCLALLPTTVIGAAGVSADPLTLGLAFLATASVLRCIDRAERCRAGRLDPFARRTGGPVRGARALQGRRESARSARVGHPDDRVRQPPSSPHVEPGDVGCRRALRWDLGAHGHLLRPRHDDPRR